MLQFTRAFLFLLIAFSGFLHTQTQTVEAGIQTGTGSISGLVTLSGEPRGNVVISIIKTRPAGQQGGGGDDGDIKPRLSYNTTTSSNGWYRFSNLPAGTYRIRALSKVLMMIGSEVGAGKSITLAEGEAKENVNLALMRGGIITGRVTDSEGRPLIAAQIILRVLRGFAGASDSAQYFEGWSSANLEMLQTDDRGVYRIYGLSKGRYIVGAGGATSLPRSNPAARDYPRTWYPGVTDQKQAKLLEIDDGVEITDVDITFRESQRTYEVLGRVVDAETGAPVIMASVYCYKREAKRDDSRSSNSQTDVQGRFRLTGLTNGAYELRYQNLGENNQFFVEPTTFVIADGNVDGVELKARRGASISGLVAYEGAVNQELWGRLKTVGLSVEILRKTAEAESQEGAVAKLEADGRFRVTGIPPGKVFFQSMKWVTHPLQLSRTECNGVEVWDGIDVSAGQNITGVRLVFAEGKGAIRGQIQITGGALPQNAEVNVTATPIIRNNSTNNRHYNDRAGFANVNSKGHFEIKGLLPGEYEIWVDIAPRVRRDIKRIYRSGKPEQLVNVPNSAEINVAIDIDLSKINREEQY